MTKYMLTAEQALDLIGVASRSKNVNVSANDRGVIKWAGKTGQPIEIIVGDGLYEADVANGYHIPLLKYAAIAWVEQNQPQPVS